jgi:phosphate-selective porin OprO and OprP
MKLIFTFKLQERRREMIMELKKYLGVLFSSIMIICVASFATPAYAANDALLGLMKILRDKGSITHEEYNLLLKASEAEDKNAKAEVKKDVEQQVAEATKGVPKITTKGKFKVESQDGDWAFQPIGRIFWDNIWTDDDGSSAEDSGTELRRARLGFQGTFLKHWKSKLEVDFANSGTPSWKDSWISYNGKNSLGKYFIKVGHHHVPFGHTTISSSKYMPLMRRPLFGDGPTLSRAVGVAIREDSKRWFVHAGVFRPGLSSSSDERGDNSGSSDAIHTAIRVAGTPVFQDKKHLVHVGASYLHTNNNGDSFNYVDNALITHIGSGGTLDANFGRNTKDIDAFDLEALSVWGPFHVVGEYVHWSVNDPDGDADLSAWSIDAGWFLTGESMKYKAGQFSGISPKNPFLRGGFGAWQIAVRYENMDLNDGTAITGGEAYVFTAGINWYPVKNIRFMANYAHVLDYDRPGNANNGLEPSAFSLRGQVYW